MKKILIFIGVTVLAACGGERENIEELIEEIESTEEVVEEDNAIYPITWDDVLTNNLTAEKIVTIEGYLAGPGMYVSQSYGTMTVYIYPKRNQSIGESVNFTMPLGTDANHVHELPEEFVPEDFVVVDQDGNEMSEGAKVLVEVKVKESIFDEGEMNFEFRSIKKLEDAPIISETVFADAIELTDAVIADTTKKEIYGWAEGSFELPMMVFENNGRLRITFRNKSNEEIKSVAIKVGDGPSTMNDLPEDFTDKDFVVRDYKGDPITVTRVRIYGTYHRSEYSNDGLFYLEEIEAR
ncbi:MAG: hypothetical protein MK078_01120 [Crocinitomicaceae bacterium]|nr:hypothetical protein [Crocinitomicaceae bacterium]